MNQVSFHQDGSVSYWSVFRQQWVRNHDVSDADLAAMSPSMRAKTMKHLSKGAFDTSEFWEASHG